MTFLPKSMFWVAHKAKNYFFQSRYKTNVKLDNDRQYHIFKRAPATKKRIWSM